MLSDIQYANWPFWEAGTIRTASVGGGYWLPKDRHDGADGTSTGSSQVMQPHDLLYATANPEIQQSTLFLLRLQRVRIYNQTHVEIPYGGAMKGVSSLAL